MQPAGVKIRHDGGKLTNTDRGYPIEVETQEIAVYVQFSPNEVRVAKERNNQLLEGLEKLGARWELEHGGFRGRPGVVCRLSRNMNVDAVIQRILVQLATNLRTVAKSNS